MESRSLVDGPAGTNTRKRNRKPRQLCISKCQLQSLKMTITLQETGLMNCSVIIRNTAYSGKALLLMARASYEYGEEDESRKYLLQAIDDATEASTVHIARIRLGQLMIAEKQYEEALELLDIGNMGGLIRITTNCAEMHIVHRKN